MLFIRRTSAKLASQTALTFLFFFWGVSHGDGDSDGTTQKHRQSVELPGAWCLSSFGTSINRLLIKIVRNSRTDDSNRR